MTVTDYDDGDGTPLKTASAVPSNVIIDPLNAFIVDPAGNFITAL